MSGVESASLRHNVFSDGVFRPLLIFPYICVFVLNQKTSRICIFLLSVVSFLGVIPSAFAQQGGEPSSKPALTKGAKGAKGGKASKKGSANDEKEDEKKEEDTDEETASSTAPGALTLSTTFLGQTLTADDAEPTDSAAAESTEPESEPTPTDSTPTEVADVASEPESVETVDEGEEVVAEESEEEGSGEPSDEHPLAGLLSEEQSSESGGFEPLEDIEEGALEQILPGKIHPRVEFDGYFRTRIDMPVNYDLDTQGTSAVLPVMDSIGSEPADAEKKIAISSNMRLRFSPTIFITDDIRIHSSFDILDNVVLGSSPGRLVLGDLVRPELTATPVNSSQFSIQDVLKVRSLYGAIDTLFGSLYAGRMSSHFGLGLFDHDGACIDCDYGTVVDRIAGSTHMFGLTARVAVDFPDEGISSRAAWGNGGQPYDLAQVDDADQYSISVVYEPQGEEEKILEQKRLQHDGLPVINGGALFRWRTQDGQYTQSPSSVAGFPNALPALVYKGLKTYSLDAWAKLLYNPNDDLFFRLELEGFVHFGHVDNISDTPVGLATGTEPAVNCFGDNPSERCKTTVDGESLSRDFLQYGFALESEVRIGQLVSWGVNLGLASGGNTPNWGTSGDFPDYSFARFHRDYHVDLILFRNVIGTVTNAFYAKPYVHFEFLKSGSRYLEADVSSVLSLAMNKEGTPSGERGLGVEFDGAFRYILNDQLSAGVEAGVLFPLSGLDAIQGRKRYRRFDSRSVDFTEKHDAAIAWTVQGKFAWIF